ncbi:GATA zinc finger domain-containing protein 14-like [Sitophilus oryzae]|uniref:GATA zinc finger domain-containing protein 14-like n=1 Tax=Sitophilus oryzae TaxID=7048 RepID=A0A6J2XYC3_SITOR|nr:GATA zinc finger domain-containing protein 14-like [Sitophilus oryzae]
MSLLPYIFDIHPDKSIFSWPSLISKDEDFFKPLRSSSIWSQLTEHHKEITVDKDKFQASVNVRHYKPDEITVKLNNDRTVTIQGKHEEKPGQGYISRQFTRHYTLPDDCDAQKMQTKLSSDGVLVLSVPMKPDEDRVQIREVPATPTGSVSSRDGFSASFNKKLESSETRNASSSYNSKYDSQFEQKHQSRNIESVNASKTSYSNIESEDSLIRNVPISLSERQNKSDEDRVQIREVPATPTGSVSSRDGFSGCFNKKLESSETRNVSSSYNSNYDSEFEQKHQSRNVESVNASKTVYRNIESEDSLIKNVPISLSEAPNNSYESTSVYKNVEEQSKNKSNSNNEYNSRSDYKHVEERRQSRDVPVSYTDALSSSYESKNFQKNIEEDRRNVRDVPIKLADSFDSNVAYKNVQQESKHTRDALNNGFIDSKSDFKHVEERKQTRDTPGSYSDAFNTSYQCTNVYKSVEEDSRHAPINRVDSYDSQSAYKNVEREMNVNTKDAFGESDLRTDHKHVEERKQARERNVPINRVDSYDSQTAYKNVEHEIKHTKNTFGQTNGFSDTRLDYKQVDERKQTRDIPVNYSDTFESTKIYTNVNEDRRNVRDIPISVPETFSKTYDTQKVSKNFDEERIYKKDVGHDRKNEFSDSRSEYIEQKVQVKDIPINVSETVNKSYQSYQNVQESKQNVYDSRSNYKNVEERKQVRDIPVTFSDSRDSSYVYKNVQEEKKNVRDVPIQLSESVNKSHQSQSSYKNVDEETKYARDSSNLNNSSYNSKLNSKNVEEKIVTRDIPFGFSQARRDSYQSNVSYKNVEKETKYARDSSNLNNSSYDSKFNNKNIEEKIVTRDVPLGFSQARRDSYQSNMSYKNVEEEKRNLGGQSTYSYKKVEEQYVDVPVNVSQTTQSQYISEKYENNTGATRNIPVGTSGKRCDGSGILIKEESKKSEIREGSGNVTGSYKSTNESRQENYQKVQYRDVPINLTGPSRDVHVPVI